jgi:hypothetical protein
VSREGQRNHWVSLLTDWKLEVARIKVANSVRWELLGLPDLADFRQAPADPDSIGRLARLGAWLDAEVLAFYEVTDGWPLWLGSLRCRVLPAKEVGPFSVLYPEAFAIAAESAPSERLYQGASFEPSAIDLGSALALTGPDAREFVLSLRTGETCFYFFDGVKVLDNFHSYMKERFAEVRSWLEEMLGDAR